MRKKCLEAWKRMKKREGKREGVEKRQIEEGEEKEWAKRKKEEKVSARELLNRGKRERKEGKNEK